MARKVKVPVYKQAGKTIEVEEGASRGAQLGVNFYLPSGALATAATLAAYIGAVAASGGSTNTLSNTLWRLIGEIPANVTEVEELATSGFVVRKADGNWLTRSIASADTTHIVITDGDGDAAAPTIDVGSDVALKDVAQTIVGQWDFNARIDANLGITVTGSSINVSLASSQINIYDSDGVDPNDRFVIDHNDDALNFFHYDDSLATFVLPLQLSWSSAQVRVRDGYQLRVYDATDAYYVQLSHNGTNTTLLSNLGALQITAGSALTQFLTGMNVRIYDAGNTDYANFAHDGSNFNITFANTALMHVNGVRLAVTGADASAFPAGISGHYSTVGGSTTYGATIWALDTSYDGGYAGADSVNTTVYGIRWLRSGHVNSLAAVGEGLYILQNGGIYGGIGSSGIYTSQNLTVGGDVFTVDATSGIILAGGNSASNGSNIKLYGGSHATLANRAFVDSTIFSARSQDGGTTYATISSGGLDEYGYVAVRRTGSHLYFYDTDDAVDTADYSLLERNSNAFNVYFRDSSAATWHIGLKVADQAAVTAYFNGADVFATQSNTSTGFTSGAAVKDHVGNYYDVGFNVLPAFNFNASDTLEASHAGHITGKTNTTSYTLTGPASGDLDFPVGAVCTVANFGSSTAYNIADTATCTIYYCDGASVTDIAGAATIDPGGIATLYRYSSTAIYMWGSGITP